MSQDLKARLIALGLDACAAALDDIVATATKKRWGLVDALTHIADIEEKDRARRGLDRRMKRSKLEQFKPMVDFDWNWPTKTEASSNRSCAPTSSTRSETSSSSRRAASARR